MTSRRNLVNLFSIGVLSGGILAFSYYFLQNRQITRNTSITESSIKNTKNEIISIVNPSRIFDFCDPRPVNDILIRKGYISVYDRRMKVPIWSVVHITPESLEKSNSNRYLSKFKEDSSIPNKFRAKLSDYFQSGYDRGHMVAASDLKFSQDVLDETFYLTNIAPQVGEGFNRNYWAYFEDFCRRLTSKYTSVYIITGPLYLPKQDINGKWIVSYEMIGNPPNIAVPTHFFKVIFAENESEKDSITIGAFVLPNTVIDDNTKLTDFIVPIDAVERASGLDFTNKCTKKKKELCNEVKCSVTIFQTSRHLQTPSTTSNQNQPTA